MLNALCLMQIFLYVFLAPIAREAFDNSEIQYAYSLGLVFLIAFLISGLVVRQKSPTTTQNEAQFTLTLRAFGLMILWAFAYIAIAIEFGLINRRIGTHEAGALFASIPLSLLVFFRLYEVLLPLFLSLLVARFFNAEKISTIEIAATIILVASIGFSGALYSRSQVAFLMVTVLVLTQNTVDKTTRRNLLASAFFIALMFVATVTFYRWSSPEIYAGDEYFIQAFLERLDGLEVLSNLIKDGGIFWTGQNPDAIWPPLISSIPMLPEAAELKAAALTTVKATLLYTEYGSLQGDINSFAMLDPYYWGGVVGLIFAGAFLGYVSKWVDKNIGQAKSKAIAALQVAIACNIMIMEREYISMLTNIVRDWIVIYGFLMCFVTMNEASLGTKVIAK